MEKPTRSQRLKAFRPDLRWLILGFVLLSVLATLGNSLIVANLVQRDTLIEQALERNRAYAAKVASSIGEFLQSAQRHLAFSAGKLGQHWTDPAWLRAEAERLQGQDDDFNSIAIVDATGLVLEAYPDTAQITRSSPHTEGIDYALKARQPLVSSAYMSSAGNLVVFVSQPVFDPAGTFLGVIGGSVYLRKESALHTLIGRHFYHEGTFAFVADSKRQLLYHPDEKRIGETLDWSKTVDTALRKESGAMVVPNYKGIAMLAGYAFVPEANWAVVAQQPRNIALEPLRKLRLEMLLGLLPAGLVGLIAIWAGTLYIARPLHQLSTIAEHLAAPHTTEQLQHVNAWYRDAAAIRQALLSSVQLLQQKLGRLSKEAQSDPLTGLANRRAMTQLLELLEQTGQPYAVLALDIDHFKRVNDTFGHDAGDVALREIAAILQENSRSGDLACRAGGEEFTLILPDAEQATAAAIAERIRASIEVREVPTVGRLTVSIGVACQQPGTETAEAVLKQADERLYRAKEGGRNRVEA